ncbi:MAG: DmsE family decaheme c-type cytochrome [Gammaproteobacteria bacterium]|nr:DmsE family decaheme c-type cytochrome [Gammaproteobacteria bacterium]NNF67421.1 DmsE family decaheme c-type cytochrome [Gammaproteobacteria bacterium]
MAKYLLLAALLALLPFDVKSQAADDTESTPAYSRQGADSCLACHDDQKTLAIFRTPHAVPTDPRSPFGHGQLQCESCHGPTGEHAGRVRRGQERAPAINFGSASSTPVSVQNTLCLGCHQADTGFGWHGNGHDSNDLACADCHSSHASQDAVLQKSTQASVCFDCHRQQKSQSLKPYSHPLRDGKMACGDCHSTHGSNPEHQLVRQTATDTCYQCHAEKRGPFLWEHAPVAEDCGTCHDPHGSNHPGMVRLRDPMMCQACHSQAGHPSIVNDADGLPAATPSLYLLGRNCLNCHTQIHGSNHPSGSKLMR